MEYLIQLGVQGLKRVLANNDFSQSAQINQQLEEYTRENNPILLFSESMEDCLGERYGYHDGMFKTCVFRSVVSDFLKARGQSDRKILKDWADRGFIESFKRSGQTRYDANGKTFAGGQSRVIVVNKVLDKFSDL